MIIFFMLLISAFIIYLAIGGYALFHDRKASLNITFFLMNLSIALYSLGSSFIIAAPSRQVCIIWTKVMTVGIFSFTCVSLHFFLIVTQKKRILHKWWTYLILYIPFIFFMSAEFVTDFYIKEYILTKYGWVYVIDRISPFFIIYNIQYLTYGIFGVFLVYLHMRNAEYKREQRQAKTIVVSALTTMPIYIAIYIYSLNNYIFPSLAPATVVLWTMGILYGIVKYKFMLITKEMAADQILETIAESVIIVNQAGKIISSNKETTRLLDYSADELIEKHVGMLFLNEDRFKGENLNELLKKCPIQNMETYFISKKGETIPVILSASECRNEYNELLGYIIITRDITNIKEAEKRLDYLAHHDTLTGLPNRLLFVDRFNQEAIKAQRYKTHVALFMLDLDHFKNVNDNYGHHIGDLLLKEVSNRLKSSIRQCDSIARLGGDEFVILLTELKNKDDFEPTATRIINRVSQPFVIEEIELKVTISVGISLFPDNGKSLDGLLKNADIAMYSVKNDGRNDFKLFASKINLPANKIFNVEEELKQALKKKEFLLYYQPMVDLYSESIIGAEALVRWNHPNFGILPPADFLPQAEENGLILPLGEWVLKTACAQAKKWQESGVNSLYVSVNFSALQFKQKDLVDNILGILEETELSPENLLIEIAESNIIKDRENVINVLRKLHEHKIMVVISGFGTGYSSLLYLKEFHIYAIKIDRFFIRNIANDSRCATITKAIISLAHDLDLKVIAEGIENNEQLECLRSLEWKPSEPIKCDGAQGFLFSKPLPEYDMIDILKKQ